MGRVYYYPIYFLNGKNSYRGTNSLINIGWYNISSCQIVQLLTISLPMEKRFLICNKLETNPKLWVVLYGGTSSVGIMIWYSWTSVQHTCRKICFYTFHTTFCDALLLIKNKWEIYLRNISKKVILNQLKFLRISFPMVTS